MVQVCVCARVFLAVVGLIKVATHTSPGVFDEEETGQFGIVRRMIKNKTHRAVFFRLP